jgi:hypothetical protein
VLVKVRVEDRSAPLTLRITYTTYEKKDVTVDQVVSFPSSSVSPSESERKGILLARYVAAVRAFLQDMENLRLQREDSALLLPNKNIPFVLPKYKQTRGNPNDDPFTRDSSKDRIRTSIESLEGLLSYFDAEAALIHDVGLSVWREKIVEFITSLRKVIQPAESDPTAIAGEPNSSPPS